MKRTLLAFSILSVVLFSCNKEQPKPLSKEELSRQIDSIVQVRTKEIDARAHIDLERRMKIEVKVKVDSIVNAQLNPQTKDTAKKASAPLQGVVPQPPPAK